MAPEAPNAQQCPYTLAHPWPRGKGPGLRPYSNATWWALLSLLKLTPFWFGGPLDRKRADSAAVPSQHLGTRGGLWFPYRLHSAPSDDQGPAFLHHLGKVYGWIQEQEFEATLTKTS